jgi:tetratricopeptide (TPR) repeat protein
LASGERQEIAAGRSGLLLVSRSSLRINDVAGTPAYMAPEQYQGRNVGPKVDQFAYCVALYEALCGHRPFQGVDLTELREAIVSGPRPVWPRHVVRSFSFEFCEAIRRGLAADPAARYSTFDELLQAIRSATSRSRHLRASAWLGTSVLVGAIALLAHDRSQNVALQKCMSGVEEVSANRWSAMRERVLLHVAEEQRLNATRRQEFIERSFAAQFGALAEAGASYCNESFGERGSIFTSTSARREFPSIHPCLVSRSEELEGLARALVGRTQDNGDRVLQALSEMTTLDACWQAQSPGVMLEEPAEFGLRQSVKEVRGEMARLSSMAAGGAAKDALASMRQVRGRVVELAFLPLLTEFDYQMAVMLMNVDTPKEASFILDRAAVAAISGADGWLSARTHLLRAHVRARNTDFAEVQEELRLGSAAIERVGGDEKLRADLASIEIQEAMERADFQAVVNLAPHALEIAFDAWGPLSLRPLETELNYAIALDRIGKRTEAFELLNRVRERAEQVLGPKHSRVASILNAIANIEQLRGHFDAAAKLHFEAIDIRIASFGESSLPVSSSRYNLANALMSQGERKLAMHLFGEVLVVQSKILGPTHPWVADVHNNLSLVHFEMGQFAAARRHLEMALKMRSETMGPDAVLVGQALVNIGLVATKQGELRLAEEALRRAIVLEMRHRSGDHHEVLEARLGLAENLIVQRRTREARLELTSVLAATESLGELAVLQRIMALAAFGRAEVVDRKWAEAQGRFESALKLIGAQGPGNGDKFFTVQAELGSVLLAQGHIDEGLQRCTQALNYLEGRADELDPAYVQKARLCAREGEQLVAKIGSKRRQ